MSRRQFGDGVSGADAHSTNGMTYMDLGVGIARKGWLTRNDVVNCLPLGEIEAVLAAKKHGGKKA